MVDKPRNLTPKSENFAQWYLEILQNAELVDDRYNIKGFVIIRPWLMDIIDKIYGIWEPELKKTGHSKTLLPTLIPEETFEKDLDYIEDEGANMLS